MLRYIGKVLEIEEQDEKIIVIGDLHLGYEEVLERNGIGVGRGMFNEMIREFDEIFDKIKGRVDKVVLLGDVKHDFGEILRQEWTDVLGLFDYLLKKKNVGEIVITKGNHDNFLQNIAGKRNIQVLDYYIFGEYFMSHGDKVFNEMYGKDIITWIFGHGHPAVFITDGVKKEKYKCFLEGKYLKKKVIILPSFSSFNEGSDPRIYELGLALEFDYGKFSVHVVSSDGEVLDFGRLEDLRED